MNYKLIMLPQPILVSDSRIKVGEPYHTSDYRIVKWLQELEDASKGMSFERPKPIIAGIEGLPKLDLSLIAEEIGWVDVEELAEKFIDCYSPVENCDISWQMVDEIFKAGFKEAQSLNEKKYTNDDMYDLMDYIARNPETKGMYKGEILKKFEASNFKEYQVEVEMEKIPSAWMYTKLGESRIKITNNTIKVTKIIN